MKKIVCCIVTLLLGLCCFAACGKGGETSSGEAGVSESNNLHITQSEITLAVGESMQLEATLDLESVYIFWSVRDEHIATVSDEGLITGVAEGETICYASFGGEKAMCLVKVLGESAKPLLSVTTPYTDGITLFVGDTFNPLITVKLGDEICDGANIDYVISDAEKGIVDVEKGELFAADVGNATVSVEVTYEGQSASLSLSVTVLEKA